MLLIGCATIVKGTTQVVAIDTPGVPGAACTITMQSGPQLVTTPGSVTLKRGSDPLPISCTKDCYATGQSVIQPGAEDTSGGNWLLGGVIGVGVDIASGAAYRYPDVVTVAMTPDPKCRPGGPRMPLRHTSSQ
jgi:hypothetical protein